MIPMISFIGPSGVGKTTLLEKLLPLLRGKGLRTAVIKHHHRDFEIDKPGKDSWRFAQAGAAAVAISGPKKFALVRPLEGELALKEIVGSLGEIDLVITEGYKKERYPKIQLFRRGFPSMLLAPSREIIATVSDFPLGPADPGVPNFPFEGLMNLADFLVAFAGQ